MKNRVKAQSDHVGNWSRTSPMTFRKETIMINLPRKSDSNDWICIFSNYQRKRSHPQLYLINFHCCRWWKLLESKGSNRATGLSPFRIWHFLRGWTCFSHCMADIRRSGSFPKFTSRFYLVGDGILNLEMYIFVTPATRVSFSEAPRAVPRQFDMLRSS